jgi:L-2-hydroxyglutarate oxidase LhgO
MIAIIGGGIVGLSVAYALRRHGPVVFEKEPEVGRHQSSHNSGVIHSGVYYKPGSLKAALCVEGARRMKEFCWEHRIPHEICGKVIVAVDPGELPRLDELQRRSAANGVAAERIGPERLREIEPEACGLAALHVPGTGIADYAAVCRALAASVEVRRGARISSARELRADWIVNCAGLHSDRVARAGRRLRIVPFRGEYYTLRRASLVRGLIYPVPDPAFPFLGVHFTRMAGGGVEAGPNAVLALSREGYRWRDVRVRDLLETLAYSGFHRLAARHWKMGLKEVWRSFSKRAFLRSLQRLVPAVREEDLAQCGSGVRAQALEPDGTLVDDFRIERRLGEIHVLNAPSPAATASLAIGARIAKLIDPTVE